MNQQGNHKWKRVLMLFCVIAPLAAIIIFILNSTGIINVGNLLPYTLFLLCPLSHILMIPLMHRMGKNKDETKINDKTSCH